MTRRRLALLAAALAAILTALLGALQSAAWNGPAAPGLVRAVARALDPGLLLLPPSARLPAPAEAYFGYGRLAVAVYALLLVAGSGVRPLLARWARRTTTALAAAALAGDVGAYWVSETAGVALRRIAFWWVELPALVALALLLTGVGLARLRACRPGRPLALALPAVLAGTAALRYVPHGVLLGLAVALLVTLLAAPEDQAVGRGALAGCGAAALLGALALAVPYRPRLVAGAPPAARALVLPAPVAGLRLHVFNTGWSRMSPVLVGREHPWRPAPAFAIEHPTSGLILFDAGLPAAVAARGEAGLPAPARWLMESRADAALPAQLRAAGLDPAAVRVVIVSHLHADHVGQLAAFPAASVVAGPGTAAAAEARARGGRWREVRFAGAAPLGPFDAALDLLGDGSVLLLPGGGHTPEDLLALVSLESGPVLLTGDAVVHADWLRGLDVQRIPVDPRRAADVREQVKAFLAEVPGAAVLFGHDLRSAPCARPDVRCHGAGLAGATWTAPRLP
jgi:N-acyl homoserine lactone hydrolase